MIARGEVLGLLAPPETALAHDEDRARPAAHPFGSGPDVRFAYLSGSFAAALDGTARALRRREGLLLVIGDAGAGKTLLCRALLQQIEDGACVSMVLDPYVTFEDLLLQVLSDFGAIPPGTIAPVGVGRHQLLAVLKRFLGALASGDGSAVIVIDEAHDLSAAVLQQLRLLTNFETGDATLLQVVLVGQPDLEERLRQPDLMRLNQRVARRYVLAPLSPAETARYIAKRLSVSAALAELDGRVPLPVSFTPAAARMVSGISRGNPRAINRLCDRSLERAGEQAFLTVGRRLVRDAARQLRAEAPRRRMRVTLTAMAAAAVVLVGVPAGWIIAVWGARPAHAAVGARLPAVPAHPAALSAADGSAVARVGAAPAAWASSALTSGGVLRVTPGSSVAATPLMPAARAAEVAERLQALGLPAFVRGEGAQREAIVGPYRSRAEAEEARRSLAFHGISQSRLLLEGADEPDGAAASQLDPGAVLVAVPGRTSVVLDTGGEPREVRVHRAGDRSFDVEVGPVRQRIVPHLLTAPPDVRFVETLSLGTSDSSGEAGYLRARVTFPSSVRGNVRLSGGRVYIDLTPAGSAGATGLGVAPPAAAPEAQAGAVTPPAPPAQRRDAARDAIEAAVRRFEEIQPFLLSAVATPEPPVLSALAGTLRTLGASMRASAVPDGARDAHELLATAVERAGRAVEPGFTGDRMSEAQQALSDFAAAKVQLRDAL